MTYAYIVLLTNDNNPMDLARLGFATHHEYGIAFKFPDYDDVPGEIEKLADLFTNTFSVVDRECLRPGNEDWLDNEINILRNFD